MSTGATTLGYSKEGAMNEVLGAPSIPKALEAYIAMRKRENTYDELDTQAYLLLMAWDAQYPDDSKEQMAERAYYSWGITPYSSDAEALAARMCTITGGWHIPGTRKHELMNRDNTDAIAKLLFGPEGET